MGIYGVNRVISGQKRGYRGVLLEELGIKGIYGVNRVISGQKRGYRGVLLEGLGIEVYIRGKQGYIWTVEGV